MNTANQMGVFLNGKNQVIELLRHMDKNERDTLLAHMKIKNPQLTEELKQQSLGINDLVNYSQQELKFMSKKIPAQIFGIALKGVELKTQKIILSGLPRSYAEEAYEIMVAPAYNQNKDINRAQLKITEIMLTIKR